MSQENLFRALEMFASGVKQQQQTQSLIQASEYADQIRRSQEDEATKRQQLRDVADQLTLALSGQGLSPAQIQQAGNAIAPQRDLENKLAILAGQGANQRALKQMEIDKDNSEKMVPGFGMATQKSIAKDLIEFRANQLDATKTINRLDQIANISGKSITPTLRAEADTLAKTLQGALRLQIIGTGAVSDTERKVLDAVIPNPTAIFSLDAKSKQALKTLQQKIDVGFMNKLEAAGIKSPESSAPKSPSGNSLNKYLIKRN